MKNKRRIGLASFAAVLVALVGGAFWWTSAPTTADAKMTVYKSATCGCCSKWVDHLRANGFEVETHDTDTLNDVKNEHGVPEKLASCHTALVDGYVVEGHVPADVVKRLLKERPQATGIAVPGMPLGSPGMEAEISQPYKILLFDKQGNISVFDQR